MQIIQSTLTEARRVELLDLCTVTPTCSSLSWDEIADHRGDSAVVFHVLGRLQGPAALTLSERLLESFSGGGRLIVVDLHCLSGIDSAGFGELVRAYVAITRGGGTLALANAPKHYREFVAAMRLL